MTSKVFTALKGYIGMKGTELGKMLNVHHRLITQWGNGGRDIPDVIADKMKLLAESQGITDKDIQELEKLL